MGSDASLGAEPAVAATIREVLPKVTTLIGASLLTTVMAGFATVFLLLPQFYELALVFATIPLMAPEQKGVLAAISRSSTNRISYWQLS